MNVAIVGAGNLGSHLAKGLTEAGIHVAAIWSRNTARMKELALSINSKFVEDLQELPSDCNLVIISVSDDAIASVASQLSHLGPSTVVAHTAGSVSSDVLSESDNYGVFYPLQTFTKGRQPDWPSIPLLLTASNAAAMSRLKSLARALSNQVQEISDEERLALHLCATIANNFSNHFFNIAHRIAGENDLDFSLLLPLIRETAAKVHDMSPADAQTGAAKRGDNATIDKHVQILSAHPELQKLYLQVSQSIAQFTDAK